MKRLLKMLEPRQWIAVRAFFVIFCRARAFRATETTNHKPPSLFFFFFFLVIINSLNTSSLEIRAQEQCESRGGRPGIPSLIVYSVSVD